MEVSFYLQPFDSCCGHLLASLLLETPEEGLTRRLTLMPAFAKRSGVRRLLPYLEAFSAAGGQILTIVGANPIGDTTIEAAEDLLAVSDTLIVVRAPARTFHPKGYTLERVPRDASPTTASMIVGSNNMTKGGLWTNIEGFVGIDLDLSRAEDALLWDGFNRSIERLKDPADVYGMTHRIKDSGVVDRDSLEWLRSVLPDEEMVTRGRGAVQVPVAPGPTGPRGVGRKRIIVAVPPLIPSAQPEEHEAGLQTGVAEFSGDGLFDSVLGSFSPILEVRENPPANAIGYWKLLSDWDTSTTSAPGQILIPANCQTMLPPPQATGRADGITAEGYLDGLWIMGNQERIRSNTRFMEVTPLETQAAGNLEWRINPRVARINPQGMEAGDVMILVPVNRGQSMLRLPFLPEVAELDYVGLHVPPANPHHSDFLSLVGSRDRGHGFLMSAENE